MLECSKDAIDSTIVLLRSWSRDLNIISHMIKICTNLNVNIFRVFQILNQLEFSKRSFKMTAFR